MVVVIMSEALAFLKNNLINFIFDIFEGEKKIGSKVRVSESLSGALL